MLPRIWCPCPLLGCVPYTLVVSVSDTSITMAVKSYTVKFYIYDVRPKHKGPSLLPQPPLRARAGVD